MSIEGNVKFENAFVGFLKTDGAIVIGVGIVKLLVDKALNATFGHVVGDFEGGDGCLGGSMGWAVVGR